MSDVSKLAADVVVIGAGLSGLTAADELARAGYDVVVLEGRDRVGGMVRSTVVAGIDVDAGATWVAPHHKAIRDLAERLGCPLMPHFHDGKGILSYGGKRRVESVLDMAPWVILDITRIMKDLQKLTDGLPVTAPWVYPDGANLDSISFEEWMTSRWALDDTRKFLTMVSLVHWGTPPRDVSLFNVLRYIKNIGGVDVMLKIEGGDQQDQILGTAHGIVSKFANSIEARIFLGSPVRRVVVSGGGATVETDSLKIEARQVIVTVSPDHRSSIEFAPQLPERHHGLAGSLRLGALSKAFVAYDRPFWRSKGLSGESVSDDATVFLTFDVSPLEDGPGILMVFCDARGFDGHARDERQKRVIDHLTHLFGQRAKGATDYTDFSWGNDTFAPGGPKPAVGPTSCISFGSALREPIGPIHWAGTETADEFGGTMNGAILSGLRAAREVASKMALLSVT